MTKIRIGTSAIQFLSPFDSKKVTYTIWDEDFDLVLKAIRQSKLLKKQYAKVGKGFDVILGEEVKP